MTKTGISDLIVVGLQPWFVNYVYATEIPDQIIDFSMAFGKGSIALQNFTVQSFTFFEDDEMVIDFIEPDSFLIGLYDAGMILALDYEFKLETFPYTQLSGSAKITIQGFNLQAGASISTSPDTSDQSCGEPSCGFLTVFSINSVNINLTTFIISYIGDVNPMLELLTTILDDALIPLFTSIFDEYATVLLNQMIKPGGASHFYYDPEGTFLFMATAGSISFSDDYGTFPFFDAHSDRVDQDEQYWQQFLDPAIIEYDPFLYPDFPSIIAGTDANIFFAPAFIQNALYQQFVNERSYWEAANLFLGTKDKLACASIRTGCGDDGEYEGESSMSFLFMADSYIGMEIPELIACPGCSLEVYWRFGDPSLDPVKPIIEAVNPDSLVFLYEDLYVTVSGKDGDVGSVDFSVDFIITMRMHGLMKSDHAYFNIIQGFDEISKISFVDSSRTDKSYLPAWSAIIGVASTSYLQQVFSNFFDQRFAFSLNLPFGNTLGCTLKGEEAFYSSSGFVTVSCFFDECACDVHDFRDASRGDDGMVWCNQTV
ncbi:hypothetical protein ADUPG1_010967 [Aduncisulcus paluster]|uniref:Uncharacterized protein n=1 Tax=Aduncisulcus paluster TaxID=2918883 RepID=A0ABQ5JX42_9EUKA|nr:hypothetical protein ADUPG1_010967 [Aduncisulcus paluster]